MREHPEIPAALPRERQREMQRLVEGGGVDGEFLHWLSGEPEAELWVRGALSSGSGRAVCEVDPRGVSPFG